MDRRIIALSSLACLPFLGISSVNAEEAKNPFSANVTLTSDYAYRGISQTDDRPAIQGGFDFKHDSGFYHWRSFLLIFVERNYRLYLHQYDKIFLPFFRCFNFGGGYCTEFYISCIECHCPRKKLCNTK